MSIGWWRRLHAVPAALTCVAAAHVHVGHLAPAVGGRVKHLTALPHQRAVVAAHSVQQALQHAHAWRVTGQEHFLYIISWK